jgi:hypothetical protein
MQLNIQEADERSEVTEGMKQLQRRRQLSAEHLELIRIEEELATTGVEIHKMELVNELKMRFPGRETQIDTLMGLFGRVCVQSLCSSWY